jgi:Tfp pilus assembly protein PilN
MPNINLISARRAERVRMAKFAKGLFAGTIATAGLGIFLIAFMGGQQFMTQRAIEEQKAELEKLRPVLEEIAAAEAKRAELAPKLETLTQAQARSKRWFDVLEGLKRAVPEETWLTNFAVEAAGEAPALRLNGVTINQARVGETILRLTAQDDQYEKVDLRYTQAADRDGAKSVEFELAAQLKPLQAPEVAGGTNAPKAQ